MYNYYDRGGKPIKAWDKHVEIGENTMAQAENISRMPFIHKHVALMPDAHLGKGATVGSVIATKGAIIPAAVGVDIGCGMMAFQTSLNANDLPENLQELRTNIERKVPHGRTSTKGRSDRGAWEIIPNGVKSIWKRYLNDQFDHLVSKHQKIEKTNNINHLGTLGTGNHFIEVCLDENNQVWVMLHSGSRGVGNWIGRHFIELAKKDMEKYFIHLPDSDLSYLSEGSEHFEDYIEAVSWAQTFAALNRNIMMDRVILGMKESLRIPFKMIGKATECHHNYITKEHHFGDNVWITRKGAVRARRGDMGIIPGSMGAKSYIVRGLGNKDSFCSCSHGAGRIMSRTEAKKQISLEEHIKATDGVECRKDKDVIDESPAAYKDIDDVMKSQEDLVEIVHTLKQIVCVKG